MIIVDATIALPSLSPEQGSFHHLVPLAKDLRITLTFSSDYPHPSCAAWTSATFPLDFQPPLLPFKPPPCQPRFEDDVSCSCSHTPYSSLLPSAYGLNCDTAHSSYTIGLCPPSSFLPHSPGPATLAPCESLGHTMLCLISRH